LHITVLERATYPSGRFGAAAYHDDRWVADLGAQVLSVVDPDEEHQHVFDGGHGIDKAALLLAREEARRLVRRGLLVQVEDGALEASEERMLWPGIWKHHKAPGGMTSILEHYLREEARPDAIEFSRKVVAITPTPRDQEGRWMVSTATGGPDSKILRSESFDSVLLCIPASDVLAIKGIDKALEDSPCKALEILKGVGYDSRCAIAVWYERGGMEAALASSGLGSKVGEAPSCYEVWVGEEMPTQHKRYETIDLLLWQHTSPDSPCAVVGHTCRLLEGHPPPSSSAKERMVQMVHQAISKHVGLPLQVVESHALGSKVIDWHVSQMVRPLEAVSGVLLQHTCLEASQRPGLLIAGDFLTQSSFVGCVATASGTACRAASSAAGEY